MTTDGASKGGSTLRARMTAEGPLPWRDAARIVADVAASLSAAAALYN